MLTTQFLEIQIVKILYGLTKDFVDMVKYKYDRYVSQD